MYIHMDYTSEDSLFTLDDTQRTGAQTHARILDKILNEGTKSAQNVGSDRFWYPWPS